MSATQIEAPVAVHHILFATDFTESSSKAFKYAKVIAGHFQASVTSAHVLRASVRDWPKFGADPDYKKLYNETKQMLDKLGRQLHQAGFQADGTLLEGDPVDGILRAIKHHKADLLVLGTHGSRDLERLALGSTAEEILRKAWCPVLTVGPNVRDPYHGAVPFRRILLTTDFTPESAAAAPYAFSLAAEPASHISICHVLPEGHTRTMDATELQAKFMQAAHELMPEEIWEKSAEYLVEYGDAAEGILQLAAKLDADLIVLGVRSAGTIATHLVPGVAFRVIAGAPCPVLTVRS
jgi:nucleotide-binding universal stress UspA family protein